MNAASQASSTGSSKCLLVTNDYPPKVGGIQAYLWELWRRLPAGKTAVLTHEDLQAATFDPQQNHPIIRVPGKVLLPTNQLRDQVNAQLEATGSDLAIIDPALPLGLFGKKLNRPYGVILHGAEATIPSQLPVLRQTMGSVLRSAEVIISASQWATNIVCDQKLQTKTHYIPPGVDPQRFQPATDAQRQAARRHFGISPDALLLLSVSRLVPRKGMDDLIAIADSIHREHPQQRLELAIAGGGRDRARLEKLASAAQVPVRLLGRVPDEDLPRLYQAANIFAMLCRQRWGGLEQEGFGIVFLEAAAAGLPQLGGISGGAAEAVEHGETGFVVSTPEFSKPRLQGKLEVGSDRAAARDKLLQLVCDADLRREMGAAARRRAEISFSYDVLAAQLAGILNL